ncbi:hypothetical protein AVEN_60608-1 [Araneus ventricosus]|uniref:Uncharacterized protein n=1 Tax=Araneus ventricosus TaxID=182803 RepID=A0A4Y2AM59_ARAVE|nr:hypothetical protein AVEN_245506-1 [Araneus ventricosus]GBL80305.1 hypothetical protein AVEN_60608-1 [Araneus ventricosus]
MPKIVEVYQILDQIHYKGSVNLFVLYFLTYCCELSSKLETPVNQKGWNVRFTEKEYQRSHSGVWLTIAAPPMLDSFCERTTNHNTTPNCISNEKQPKRRHVGMPV